MPILHALVLGLVQGLSEFLPISSSGHLALVPWLFGWDDFAGRTDLEDAFDVAVHLGTLLGAMAYLWADVRKYVGAGLGWLIHRGPAGPDARLAWLIVATAVPTGVIGLLVADSIESWRDNITLIALMLIVFGIVLLIADRMGGDRDLDKVSFRDAMILGAAQSVAFQPGVSRSGVTLTVARGIGLNREASARLVFLMSLPVIAGAGAVKLLGTSIPSEFWPPFLAGIAASAVTGYVAVWGTLRLVKSRGFGVFTGYRVVVGLAVLSILATSWR